MPASDDADLLNYFYFKYCILLLGAAVMMMSGWMDLIFFLLRRNNKKCGCGEKESKKKDIWKRRFSSRGFIVY